MQPSAMLRLVVQSAKTEQPDYIMCHDTESRLASFCGCH